MTPRHHATISNALENARAYFADRAWLNGDGANVELTLHDEIESAQLALEALRKEDSHA